MPTDISGGAAGPPPQESHTARGMAESFGADAGRYDRARPSYPLGLVERLVEEAPGRSFLDVGTGTGIAARQLRAAGCDVHGVDPDARMAALAIQDGMDVDIATFEEWDEKGRTYDAVVSAQSWHWVDPVAGAAKAARVLRPGGLLAVFWNGLELPPDTSEAFMGVYRRVLPGSPLVEALAGAPKDPYAAMAGKAADGIRAAGGFGEPELWRYTWSHRYTREAWLDQVPTTGLFTRLPADALAVLLDGLGEAVDALGGAFDASYTTVAVAAATPRAAAQRGGR